MDRESHERIVQRVLALGLLLEFWQRAVKERQRETARRALNCRRDMLRAIKSNRGYEA